MPGGDGKGPAGTGAGRGTGSGRGTGMGRGMQTGGGVGRMGGNRQGAGTGGNCICPECGAAVPHGQGTPCYSMNCPQCGAKMSRQ